MTLPEKRRRAIEAAGMLLLALIDRRQSPKVPLYIRQAAARALKQYPQGRAFDTYYMERN